MVDKIVQKLEDSLYKNSLYLIVSSILGAGTGFIFWIIAARIYSTHDVGLASATISAMGLLSTVAMLGFDITFIRFIPEVKDKKILINSCLTVSALFSFLVSLFFIVFVDYLAPSLMFIKEYKIATVLFLSFTVLMTLVTLLKFGVFVGFRKAKYSFVISLATSTRLILLPFLVIFGALGIFMSYGVTFVISFIVSFLLIRKIIPQYSIRPLFKREIINAVLYYSFGNYISKIFESLPTFVLPIIVTNILGAEANAYFYIAWMISLFILAIPNNISTSMLAEGSHNQKEILEITKRTIKFIFLLLVPAVIFVFMFGKYVLLIFGENYAQKSFGVLKILVLASFIYTLNIVYITIKRVQKIIKSVITTYLSISVTTLVLCYALLTHYGIAGAGYAWICGNLVALIINGISILKRLH